MYNVQGCGLYFGETYPAEMFDQIQVSGNFCRNWIGFLAGTADAEADSRQLKATGIAPLFNIAGAAAPNSIAPPTVPKNKIK